MGYYVTYNYHMELHAGDREVVADVLHKFVQEVKPFGGSFTANGKTDSWYSFGPRPAEVEEVADAIENREVSPASGLEQISAEFGLHFEPIGMDGLRLEYISGGKLGQELEYLQRLAPLTEDGSYIHVFGEDGALFGLSFEGGRAKQVTGTITWA